MQMGRIALRALVITALTCAFGACGSQPEPPKHCTDPLAPQPAFMVHVLRGDGGRLPADLRLRVTYGSGVEQYDPAQISTPRVLFCAPERIDASTGVGIVNLDCQLWTQGPATLEVQSFEFPTIRRELVPDPEQCTREEQIDLMHADAGTHST